MNIDDIQDRTRRIRFKSVLTGKSEQEVNKMETKSRYEVITELEAKKRELIIERDSFEGQVKQREKQLKNLNRQLEDVEEELTEFKDSIKDKKETITELIKSVDDSLNRLGKMGKSQSQKK